MLYYKFKDYEEFKELFGMVKHENGQENRKNKILLSFLKSKKLLRDAVSTGDYSMLHISDIISLKVAVTEKILESGRNDDSLPLRVNVMDYTFYSDKYETDDNNGLCEDGDNKAIRYINHDNGGRIFKMKAGKFFRTLILQTEYGKNLNETVINFLCEEFAAEWQTYTMGRLPKNRLCVDTDFERIYSSRFCEGDFCSCMVDRERHEFYENAVNASAAYLEDENGMVIARCIIYNDVKDQDGKSWRLAERQYSTNSNDILKRALIDALIKGKYIDGYKTVGASCNEPTAFVDIHGNSLSDRKFSIECNLEWEDVLSYQDSFKWYNMSKNRAYNYDNGDLDLSTTEESLDSAEREYDDYHGYYCNETVLVYVEGREYHCDVENLNGFIWVNSEEEYHHKDDVEKCPECEEYFLGSQGVYSDLTEKTYCDSECCSEAESMYMEENWHYSFYDGKYYESEEDLTLYFEWNSATMAYAEKTISIETLQELMEEGRMYRFGDVYFREIDPDTNLPYGYELIKTAA